MRCLLVTRWLFITLICCLSTQAHSGTGARTTKLEYILVTARKISEQSIKLPASVIAFDTERLDEDRILNYQDLVLREASLFATNVFSAVDTPVALRGVAGNGSREPSVGHFIDGIYRGGEPGMLSQDLVDIERVEILYGPQSALYGKSSTAGVVNIITRSPSKEREVSGSADWNSAGRQRYTAVANGRLTGNLSGRFAASHVSSRGVRQRDDSKPRLGESNDSYARVKFRWEPLSSFELESSLFFRDVEQEPYPFRAVRDSTDRTGQDTGANQASELTLRTAGYTFVAKLKSELFDFDFLAGGNYSDQEFLGDLDNSSAPFLLISRDIKRSDNSFEFRISANRDEFSWLVGFYSFQQNEDSNQQIASGTSFMQPIANASGKRTANSYSIFARAKLSLTSKNFLDLESRVDYDRRRQRSAFGSRKRSFTEASAKVTLSHRLPANVLAFASSAWAHRPGGFNDDPLPQYEPEFTWTNEVGLKVPFQSDRGFLTLAVHHTRIKDQQITEIDPVSAAQIISNRGSAKIYGVELNSEFRATETLTTFTSANWLKAEYVNAVVSALGPIGIQDVDISGNQLTNAPEYSAVLGIIYRTTWDTRITKLNFDGRTDCRFSGRQAWDQINSAIAPANAVCRLRASVDIPRGTMMLYIDNLFDKRYQASYIPGYLLPFSNGSDLAVFGPERTIGLRFSGSF